MGEKPLIAVDKKEEKNFVFKAQSPVYRPSGDLSKTDKLSVAFCVPVLAELFGILQTGNQQVRNPKRHN
jgi:hypothetical protein